ncbi:MAG: phosphonate ABC transporter, permease protein PhnE, partial [Alphaproteobacteria bacterium]
MALAEHHAADVERILAKRSRSRRVRGVMYGVILLLVAFSVETTIVNDTDWERMGSFGNVMEQVGQFIGMDWDLLPGL